MWIAFWIAAPTGLVALENLAPKGELVARALGGAMIGAGVAKWAWTSLPSSRVSKILLCEDATLRRRLDEALRGPVV